MEKPNQYVRDTGRFILTLIVAIGVVLSIGCTEAPIESEAHTDSASYKSIVIGPDAQDSISFVERDVKLTLDAGYSTVTARAKIVGGGTSSMHHSVVSRRVLPNLYVLLVDDFNRVLLVDTRTDNVIHLESVWPDEVQIQGTRLYALVKYSHIQRAEWVGQIYFVDLSDPLLAIHYVNDLNGVTSNTGWATSVFSVHDAIQSPFVFQGHYAGVDTIFPAPSFLARNGEVYAMSGPQGGPRIVIFEEGEAAYDCNHNGIFDVGGGGSAGAFQTENGDIYHLERFTTGTNLVKIGMQRSGGCVAPTLVSSLGAVSGYPANPNHNIGVTASYSISDLERFIISPTGFIKTSDDGSGGVAIAWTALDLSDVPDLTEYGDRYHNHGYLGRTMVSIDGDYVYYLKNNDIYVQKLEAGSTPLVHHSSSAQIVQFFVASGVVRFKTIDGAEHSIPGI